MEKPTQTIFYLTLCENLSGELEPIVLDDNKSAKDLLNDYFDEAKKIDYQAIFRPYFTDSIKYSDLADKAIYALLQVLTAFDFKVLPTEVIGHILENLVPDDEKQKFGQYFTNGIIYNFRSGNSDDGKRSNSRRRNSSFYTSKSH